MKKERVLLFHNNCVVNDEIWFVAREFNGVFRGNLITGKVDFIGAFPGCSLKKQLMDVLVAGTGEHMYFVMRCGKKLWIYDKKTQKFKVHLTENRADCYAMSMVYKYKGKLYYMPQAGSQIMKIEVAEEKIIFLEYKEKMAEIDAFNFITVENKNMIYLTSEKSNHIVTFDMEYENLEKYAIGGNHDRYQIITVKDDILYLYNIDTKAIILWNVISKKIVATHWTHVDRMWAYMYMQEKDYAVETGLAGEGIQIFDIKKMQKRKYQKMDAVKFASSYEIMSVFKYHGRIYYLWSGDGAVYDAISQNRLVEIVLDEGLKNAITEHLTYGAIRDEMDEVEFFSFENYVNYLEKNYLEAE